ncbi:MAG: GWxTD domain-containing protein [Saprospiraceae bacterium]|nr:GWxTD domain-containing protein [Saprospiraceae bacterium]
MSRIFRKGCLLSLSVLLTAQLTALESSVSISRFTAQGKPFAEIFFYILGSSVTADSLGQASIQCTYLIYRDSVVVAGDKYNLLSGVGDGHGDFMDLKRHYLSPGRHSLTVEFVDNQDTTNNLTITRSFEIVAPTAGIAQSDIQLLASAAPATEQDIWVKNGVHCIALPYDFYHKGLDRLILYNELYGTEQLSGEDFYVRYAIASASAPDDFLLKSHKRMQPAPVIPLLQTIDISRLSSGEYVIRVEAFTRDHHPLSSASHLFVRSNPEADQLFVESMPQLYDQSFVLSMDADSVRYALKSLAPKVAPDDVEVLNYLIRKGALDNQRRFIHQFWLETDAQDPEGAYREYMDVVAAVDLMYHSGLGHGFETDRGHIYLKYGAPDDMVAVEDEPSAPPYEIWIYYAFPVTNQSDVKFLFYDPSLSNHFQLLHSTAEGEINNPRWEQELYRDALTESAPGDFIDGAPVQETFHRSARRYFKDY